jgi:nucleoside 2-deoxyribosyltransferase
MVKVYLAGQRQTGERMVEWGVLLEEAGFEVTSRWIAQPLGPQLSFLAPENIEARKTFAHQDLADLDAADVVIVRGEEKFLRPGRGKFVEVGYALAKEKPIILVGEAEMIFDSLYATVDTIEQAITALLGLEGCGCG